VGKEEDKKEQENLSLSLKVPLCFISSPPWKTVVVLRGIFVLLSHFSISTKTQLFGFFFTSMTLTIVDLNYSTMSSRNIKIDVNFYVLKFRFTAIVSMSNERERKFINFFFKTNPTGEIILKS
jgi:hypothetical protein